MYLSDQLKSQMIAHAKQCYPAECCGVVIDENYYPCRNQAKQADQFEIHYQDLADLEDLHGEITAYVHSHPDGTTKASELDLHQIELHAKTWIIVSYSEQEHAEPPDFAIYQPVGYQSPLLGRNYHHGWQDCYAIVRDFYQRELHIALPDFERKDVWWEDKNHPALYENHFAQAGFMQVEHQSYQYGDVLLCRVGRTEHINHAVIWLGENSQFKSEHVSPCVGNSLILHHPYGRKSVREVFGENWLKRVALVVRHQSLI